MTMQGAYGEQLGRSYRLSNMPALMTQSIRKTPIAVTRCKFDKANHGLTTPLPREDAFMVVLQLGDWCDRDLWLDGKPVTTKPLSAGEVVFHDLRRSPSFNLRSPLDSLHLYLPRKTLDAIADDANSPRIEDLRFTPGIGVSDWILAALGRLLLPAFDRPEHISQLFIDHVTLAIGVHVAQTYGGMNKGSRTLRGGLAVWQERRAKELLSANLNGELSIACIAAECDLSSAHFSRAFRRSTGLSPHQWLVQRRIDAAKVLLRDTKQSLPDIAYSCGFSDQAHFTRVYTRLNGISPGAWRRQLDDRMYQNEQQFEPFS
jgi:AraC family transcriptional regulator